MKRLTALFAGLTILSVTLSSAKAQTYPIKPITIILGTQAGSGADTFIRLLGPKMSEGFKQPIVIENVVGVGGIIGAEKVANSLPDGYVFGLIGDSALLYSSNLTPGTKFDPVTDLEPVTFGAGITWGLVVNSAVPARNVRELIALAKAQPNKFDYASGGNGSAQHVGMELFKVASGISLTHVPYKGATQATNDVVAGHVPVMFSALVVALPHIKDGRLRALAVPSEKRSSLLPEVPTMAEAGVPGFTFNSWMGIFAPRKTPKAIVERMQQEVAKALADPALNERFINLGLEPRSSTPAELGSMTREGYTKMKSMFKSTGIRQD